jgi:hypothetical protein
MTPEPKLDLIGLREELERQYGVGPSYSQLWFAAANGRIPARREGRSWRVSTTDLPTIAEYFQLASAAPDAA